MNPGGLRPLTFSPILFPFFPGIFETRRDYDVYLETNQMAYNVIFPNNPVYCQSVIHSALLPVSHAEKLTRKIHIIIIIERYTFRENLLNETVRAFDPDTLVKACKFPSKYGNLIICPRADMKVLY